MLKRFLMVVGLLLLPQLPVRAGGFEFDPPVNLRWPGGTYAVSVADFNGDGRDDIAALNSGHLEVVLQGPSGTFEVPIALGMSSARFLTLSQADVGANGTREILVGHDKGLAIYRWGGAEFQIENHPSASPCLFMASADLNFDGSPDIFCHGYHGDASLYYSNSTGALGAPVYMQTGIHGSEVADYVHQAQLKDVTGDGRPDLLLAGSASNAFFVHPHDGVRGFLPATSYTYPPEYEASSGAIEAADLDGDGANELVVATGCNSPCSTILIYKRDASGYLALSRTLPTYDNPWALLTYDIDRNGKQDLLVGHAGWSAVGLYMASAEGLSSEEIVFEVQTRAHSERYSIGDLNHDGYNDLAVANSFGVSVLYGRPEYPVANDFDGDAVSDVLWHRGSGANAVWLSANSATPQLIDSADAAWLPQSTGDFDGDGIGEIFLRNRTTGSNQIWETGSEPRTVTTVTSQDWQVVGSGDFDGDDQSDLLWRNSRTGANVIWKSGDYHSQQAVRGVTDLHWQVAGVGDFDRDGRSDILWRHSASGKNAIWLSGRFETQQAITAVTNTQWQIQGVGDFNGDGRDDVVWRNVGTGANAIWHSGDYRTQASVVTVTNPDWSIAAVGDYDGDGVSDLFWRNGKTGVNAIWRFADYKKQQAVTAVHPAWEVVR